MRCRLLFFWIVVGLSTTLHAADPLPILAYYHADPLRFNPSSAWMGGFIRLLDAAGVVPLREQPVADGVLAATVLGTYSHSVTLLDLRAARGAPGEVRIDRAQAVLTIDAPGQSASLRRTLATILSHYGQPGDREQSALPLPGGRQGVRYRIKGWPAWVALEWYSDEDRFHVAVGAGALARYFEEVEGGRRSDSLADHRQSVRAGAATRPANDPVELYVNLAALRGSAPTLFQTGRLTPILELLGLRGDDSWMLHGWWSGRFLMFAVTTGRGGKTSVRVLTRDTWPEDAGVPRPEANFYLVAPIDWPEAAARLLRLASLTLEPADRAAFDRLVAGYRRAAGVDPAVFLHQLRPVLLMSDYPRAWLPVPGTATIYAPLAGGVSDPEARAQFVALMRPIVEGFESAATTPADPRSLKVIHDDRADVYWLDSPLRQLFKAPAWGWVAGTQGGVLVSSFSPAAVLENRRWLGSP
jgi:hypothetical protein